ncbi:hypothetical protein EV426DRAFT_279846 [Tirmania nivea]|nr:hypothetical protein EV426DRAFT_279846 [Tirmania nivea]
MGASREYSRLGDAGTYNFAEVTNKSLFAKLVLPCMYKDYKTKALEHCIGKTYRKSVEQEAEEANEGLHPAWKAPPVVRTFRWDVFLSLYFCHYHRAAPLLFRQLRREVYNIDEDYYQDQFTKPLKLASGLGFSGSVFFFTQNKDYIIKSIGRRFEYIFLYKELLDPLADYITHNRDTLLSKITDVLYSFDHRLGSYLGVSPSHFIIMRNDLTRFDKGRGCKKWDLKPPNFFEPTRDLVPDRIKSKAAKSGLADGMDEEIILARKQKADLMSLLERDTEFLMQKEIIDYSLLLGRYPVDMFGEVPQPESFFTGVRSGDGKWIYKMCILDFLWNVKQLHPKIIQAAGTALPEQTITTQPHRYRTEFLKMMDDYIEIYDG